MFQYLRIGNPRIGHVMMHSLGTFKTRSCPTTTTDSLIVTIAVIPHHEVIHGPLAACNYSESLQQGIGQSLADFHIATDDGGTFLPGCIEIRIQ